MKVTEYHLSKQPLMEVDHTRILDGIPLSAQLYRKPLPVDSPLRHGLAREVSHTSTNVSKPRREKQPLSWTHPAVLLLFCAVFIMIIGGLALLTRFSQLYDGYSIPEHVGSYIWTFAPTALLTIVIACWRQVDRMTRLKQPWLELSSGPAPAERNLLLDYVSPLLPVALYSSIRKKHWKVSATIVVFVLLKVVLAFSTSILTVRMANSTTTHVVTTLQDPSFVSAPPLDSDFFNTEVYGNMKRGLDFPLGVTANASHQVLSSSNNFPVNANITTEVMGAFIDMDCQPAQVNVTLWNITSAGYDDDGNLTGYANQLNMAITVNSTDCNGVLPYYSIYTSCLDAPVNDNCSSTHYIAVGGFWTCNKFAQSPNFSNQTNAVVLTILALVPYSGPHKSIVKWSTGAVCRPKYSIERADLSSTARSIGTNQDAVLSNPKTSTGALLPNFAPSNLTEAVSKMMGPAESKSLYTFPVLPNFTWSDVDLYFEFMFNDLGTFDIEVFRNYTVMVNSGRGIFQRFAAHYLASRVSFPNHTQILGSYTSSTERLFILDSTIWSSAVLLGLATIIAFVLAIGSLDSSSMLKPESLTALAAFIPPKSGVFKALAGVGHTSDQHLAAHLRGKVFMIQRVSQKRTIIEARSFASAHAIDTKEDGLSEAKITQYWIPISARKWFMAICVVVPAVVIIVLEILQRMSDAHNGIANTRYSSRVNQSMASLIPAIVMLSTAALYSAAEWAINIFTSFSMAKKRTVPLKRVDRNNAEGMPPVAIIHALMKRHYAVAIIIASTVLASFLTIFASGLMTVRVVPQPTAVSAYTTTQFITSITHPTLGATGQMFSLIHKHNGSYPAGTYDNLAFSLLRLNESLPDMQRALASAVSVEIDLPVLRASLNCTEVPTEKMNYSMIPGTEGKSYVSSPKLHLTATLDLPKECQYSSGMYRNSSKLAVTWKMPIASDFNYTIDVLDAMNVVASGVEDDDNFFQTYSELSWPDNCPSMAFVAGSFGNDTDVQNKHIFLCTQIQQEIPATITFNLPSLTINTHNPPRLHEQQARKISAYQYTDIFLLDYNHQDISDYPTESIALFYNYALNLTGTPVTSIQGSTPPNRANLYNLTNWMYSQYMSQLFSDQMRLTETDIISTAKNVTVGNQSFFLTDGTSLPLHTLVNGTFLNQDAMRVFQNNQSKIILQVLLAMMVVALLVAYFITDVSATLAHNPCSIAGVASLVVGSGLADECADVAALCDDQVEPERRLGEREVMLGWWVGGEVQVRRRFGLDFVGGEG